MIDTNTGRFVLSAINMIASTPSKNEKKELIKSAGSQSQLFMRAVTFCYDPFKNYGRRNLTPVVTHGSLDLSSPQVWAILGHLLNRSLSGDDGIAAVDQLMLQLDPDSAEVVRRIINKDMRAGFSEGTVNEVFKGTFKEFPYMRCTLPTKSNMGLWDWAEGIYSQLKADGSFANVNHDLTGQVWITTRQGTMYPDYALGVENDVHEFIQKGTQSHGELVVYADNVLLKRQVGNGLLNSLAQGEPLPSNHIVVYESWDQIPIDKVVPKGEYNVPYDLRYKSLEGQVSESSRIRMIETRIVRSKAEAYGHYREKLAEGLEGTVCKHPAMGWRDTGDAGSKDQVKLKLDASFEARIKGFNPGKPGTKREKTFGSLQCVTECGLMEFGVGIGISDKMLAEISANREKYLGAIIQVSGNGIMEPSESNDLHSLFIPKFGEIRTDKRTADTLEQVRDQFEAAMAAA